MQIILMRVFLDKSEDECKYSHLFPYTDIGSRSMLYNLQCCFSFFLCVFISNVQAWSELPNLVLDSIFDSYLERKCTGCILPNSRNKHTSFDLMFSLEETDNIGGNSLTCESSFNTRVLIVSIFFFYEDRYATI
jgi:hypothetical protein